MFKPCIVIPIYNHGETIGLTIGKLMAYSCPIYVVDDGSSVHTKAVLQALKSQYSTLNVVHLPFNQGKGAAVMEGFRQAFAAGFTHALQIDADGQHDTDDVPTFFARAKQNPEAVVCGRPIYDDSVPKARLYGRYFTHVWVWIETLSFSIQDSMCGFRLYPLVATCRLIDQTHIPLRMDFDIEIIVKLAWMGVPIENVATKVIYPQDGVSHFHMIKDNWRITKMHTRLFFGMLRRLPSLLGRTSKDKPRHWAQLAERGGLLGIRCVMWIQRLLGRRVTECLLHPIVLYFYLTAPRARASSFDFLNRVAQRLGSRPPSRLDIYRHMYAFACSGVDKLSAWRGDLDADLVDFHGKEHLDRLTVGGRGALLLGSHLGNMEMMRALASKDKKIKITVLMYTDHAEKFNSVLSSTSDGFSVSLLQIRDMGVDTAILLKEKIEQGEWLVIVGDRTPPNESKRVVQAEFLGEQAWFAQGPMVLASLLECPVYLFFCVREGRRFRVDFEPFADAIALPRANRSEAIQRWVQRYAHRLEAYALRAPSQWFNFFDFWEKGERNSNSAPSNLEQK
jgi:predicted LPLAT superfamily acyltransferase/GT2 family glycosyltransferase